MLDIIGNIYQNIYLFLFILLRITAYVFISPVFGRKNMPKLYKIGFSIFLAYNIFYMLLGSIQINTLNYIDLIIICIKETVIGLSLGFISSMFFSLFYITGQIVDMQIGFNAGGITDPQLNARVSITGNFITVVTFVIFLRLNGHLYLVKILYEMYNVVPVMGGSFTQNAANIAIEGFNLAFLMAVKAAIPVVGVIFITQFILGVIIKFIPQMNIFTIGIPVKLFIGLTIFELMINPISVYIEKVFKNMLDFTNILISAIGT